MYIERYSDLMTITSDRINKIFNNTKADVVFIMNTAVQDSNFTYLTGFTGGVFEDAVLLATKNKLLLPVSVLEYEIAKREKPKEMTVIKVDSWKRMKKLIKKYTKSKVVGINSRFLPYGFYQFMKKEGKPKKIIDCSAAFAAARAVKDAHELRNIRIANKIAKRAIDEVKAKLRAGMTEKEAAAMIDYSMMKQGASGAAFPSIVAFDRNSALPHHGPDNTRLKKNGIVLMDIGAKYNNYCSDITRTFAFRPDPGSSKYKKFLEMHKIVKEAQMEGFKKIREGASGAEAHNAAAGHINNAKGGIYKGKFIHSLGHSIGIEVHDTGPGLYQNSKEKLKANMVVSDEPGIYIVGFGGVRIEDDVIVTKQGAIML